VENIPKTYPHAIKGYGCANRLRKLMWKHNGETTSLESNYGQITGKSIRRSRNKKAPVRRLFEPDFIWSF